MSGEGQARRVKRFSGRRVRREAGHLAQGEVAGRDLHEGEVRGGGGGGCREGASGRGAGEEPDGDGAVMEGGGDAVVRGGRVPLRGETLGVGVHAHEFAWTTAAKRPEMNVCM